MKKIFILLFAFTFTFSACEKDDICDPNTPTTPRLVITFHDISNASIEKNVNNLKAVGEGMSEGVIFNPTLSGEQQYLANSSKIMIPLKTDGDVSSFSFTLNSGHPNPTVVNTDNLKFEYIRETVYVSRACGHKMLFTLNPNSPITLTEGPKPDGLWIKYISVEKNYIENEKETHVKIFF